jgi:hypothetical protein
LSPAEELVLPGVEAPEVPPADPVPLPEPPEPEPDPLEGEPDPLEGEPEPFEPPDPLGPFEDLPEPEDPLEGVVEPLLAARTTTVPCMKVWIAQW